MTSNTDETRYLEWLGDDGKPVPWKILWLKNGFGQENDTCNGQDVEIIEEWMPPMPGDAAGIDFKVTKQVAKDADGTLYLSLKFGEGWDGSFAGAMSRLKFRFAEIPSQPNPAQMETVLRSTDKLNAGKVGSLDFGYVQIHKMKLNDKDKYVAKLKFSAIDGAGVRREAAAYWCWPE